MKISLNVVQQYLNYHLPDTETVIKNIGEQLGAVEEVIEIGDKYKGAVIVKVVSCIRHDNSDHLSICRIDDGGAIKDADRGEDGLIQVVCGAPNVRAGMTAVWLHPGSTVPSTYGVEPFVLGARKLRGVLSNGMLASAKELDLGDDHSGLLEIEEDIEAGKNFGDAYDLTNDVIIDIENKMFTHRPDCFGVLGVAREIAGIQGKQFTSPELYTVGPEFIAPQSDLPFNINNQIPKLAPRFTMVSMSNVVVKQSPVWLRVELARYGQKSINNIVDLTNYFMLITGQPLHAYDYDKVRTLNNDETPTIIIRNTNKGEELALLNGKTIQPRDDAIIIATSQKAIGLGGVMGGSETEVDETTKNILLECANFDMYNIRRTSMTHGLFTDAVTRFNKGQSPHQCVAVLNRIVRAIDEFGFGKVASGLADDNHADQAVSTVRITPEFINERLGTSLNIDEIQTILKNVEFDVTQEGNELIINSPFWRTDIAIPEDIVEEIGRLYGFHNVSRSLPKRSIEPVQPNDLLGIKSTVRKTLASYGANELLTYSFVHGNLIESAQQNKDLAFKIGNALSPSLQYYRMSITPSLLSNVHSNIKAGYDKFTLFEIGKTHNKMHIDDDNSVPREYEMLALVYASNKKSKQPAFYEARNYLNELANSFGISLEFRVIESDADYPVTNPYDLSRSALAYAAGSDVFIGIVGEYKSSVRKKLKLPESTAGFEIGLSELLAAKDISSKYKPLSKFPHVSQDICLQVNGDISYAQITGLLKQELKCLTAHEESIEWEAIDIYTSDELDGQKRYTYRVTLTSYVRTLNDAVLGNILDGVTAKLSESIGAQRI